MLVKFSEAFRLLGRNFGLFTAIILTVWLPGNTFANYVAYNAEPASDIGFVRSSMWIEAIFGPIYIGALVYALFQIKSGRTVTYQEAIAVGFKKWGPLFAAKFVAGILMGLGLIAFVIPGVMLAVRYSLVDAAVIVEGKSASASLRRSTELTVGRRWQIFWAGVLFCFPFMSLSVAVYLPLAFVESLDIMPVAVVLDCGLDMDFALLQIVVFLFYWEAVQEENPVDDGATPHDRPRPQWNAEIAKGADPNDNPYRSPAS